MIPYIYFSALEKYLNLKKICYIMSDVSLNRKNIKKKKVLLIFDLDGVLINSKNMYRDYIFPLSLREVGYNCTPEEIEPYLGRKVEEVISNLIPDSDSKKEEKVKLAKKYADKLSVSKEALSKVVLCPYVKEVVRNLSKNYFMTILTNSNRPFANEILSSFSIDNYWERIITADDGFASKEEAIRYLIREFNVELEKTVYIGDMVRDIELSRKIGCRTIVIPGWDTKEELEKEKPEHILNSLEELPKILEELFDL
jgi:phosphoglycolate phosphatase-like HAD superfamily hydrolase